MSRKPARVLKEVLIFALSACTHAGSADDFGFGGPRDETAVIAVDNQYFGEMIIYIVEGSARTRIGTVAALSTAKLTVPDQLVGMNVQLQANPLSPGVGFTSQHLLIAPGSTVALRLASELPLSDVSIR
jgi:hypothetical protein